MDGSFDHAQLMDATYRHQRKIYDLTRRYYLLGRDRMIANLTPPPSARILEVACGTGRNLDLISRAYPGAALYGLDISEEMLRSARMRLAGRAILARADACHFDALQIFDVDRFDRIVLSYSLSMIPDWEGALRQAVRYLAPGGELHVVDFGDQGGLPRWFRAGLKFWLARFHVTPRLDLAGAISDASAEIAASSRHGALYRGYAQFGVVQRAS